MIPLLTLRQAAATLQVSIRSVRRLVDAGALPAIRLGRLVRIDSADLAALIHTQFQSLLSWISRIGFCGRFRPPPLSCNKAIPFGGIDV